MTTLYRMQTRCKAISPRGSFGEITATFGEQGTDALNVRIECTVADFQVGKQYLITIAEMDEEVKSMP